MNFFATKEQMAKHDALKVMSTMGSNGNLALIIYDESSPKDTCLFNELKDLFMTMKEDCIVPTKLAEYLSSEVDLNCDMTVKIGEIYQRLSGPDVRANLPDYVFAQVEAKPEMANAA